jgi:hypothetical protein
MTTLFEEITGQKGEDTNTDLKLIQDIDNRIRAWAAQGFIYTNVILESWPSEQVIRYYQKQGFTVNVYTPHGNLWLVIKWSKNK